MPLSDDLADLATWVGICLGETHEMTRAGLAELHALLGGMVGRAAQLEDTLARTAEALSPGQDRAALREGVLTGKVALLAAHRIRRVPDLPAIPLDRRFGEDDPNGAA